MLDLDKVLDIVCGVQAISDFAYDIHYGAKGAFFYPLHLLSERVGDTEEVSDFKDEFFEVVWMGRGFDVPSSTVVQDKVRALTPTKTEDMDLNLKTLRAMIVQCLISIEELQDLSVGEGDLFGRLANWLQRNNGLLWNQLSYEQ